MGHKSARRRKSADGNIRNINFKLRLSLGEKARLLALANEAELSMSDYILRRTIYDEQPIYVVDAAALMALSRELAYQGNNLNQAVHALNAALAAPHSPRFEGLISEGVKSVLHQEATRIAIYDKLDESVCKLMAMRFTKRNL